MAKRQIYTTAKGVAMYPHLRKPETYEGQEIGLTIKLMLEAEETEKFKAFLMGEVEKAKSMPEYKGKSFANPNIGLGETKDGDEYFKFKTKSTFTNKQGETFKKTVPIYDSKGKPLPDNVEVGSGSIVRVAYSVNPYWKNKTMKGVTLYLEAVQVIELKEYGQQDAGAFGFDIEEDGYVAADAETVESPFTGDEDTENGADF